MKLPKFCPICNNRLKKDVNPQINSSKICCAKSPGHYLGYLFDEKSQLTHVFLTLDNYSSIELRTIHNETIFYYNPKSNLDFLVIPKLLIPDFPSLSKLKQKLSILRVFI